MEDYPQLINLIHDEIQAEPRIKKNSESTRTTIYMDKLEHDEKKMVLAGTHIPFRTYSLKMQKPKKLVIHRLGLFDVSDIKENLELQGLKIEKVVQFKQNEEATLHNPSYLVTLHKDAKFQEELKIRTALYMIVRWEKYRNSKMVTQCRRCHAFGHGTQNCYAKPKCVKCLKDHPTQDCDKLDRNAPAQCVISKGSHPANYSRCAAYLRHLEKIQQVRSQRRNVQYQAPPKQPTYKETYNKDFPALLRRSQQSIDSTPQYAPEKNAWTTRKATNDSSESGPSIIQDLLSVFKEINQYCDLGILLKIALRIEERLLKCTSDMHPIFSQPNTVKYC